nr:MAG TPA: hypothetical protein [Inoviridae sp.]
MFFVPRFLCYSFLLFVRTNFLTLLCVHQQSFTLCLC